MADGIPALANAAGAKTLGSAVAANHNMNGDKGFYNNANSSIANHGTSVSAAIPFYDSPGVDKWTLWGITIQDNFQTYLEFKPDGEGSIWVTLSIVTWGWGATENGAKLNSVSTVQPTNQDSVLFPVWSKITHGQGAQ